MPRVENFSSISTTPAWLIPLPGAIPLDPFELDAATRKRLVIGRNKDCDLPLPIQAEEVSRRHAEFIHHGGQWCVADLASRWGTSVNGVKLNPNRRVPLNEGDLVQIRPWTFRFTHRNKSATNSASLENDDKSHVRTLVGPPRQPLRQDLLQLLLEASSAIQSAEDESSLAAVVLDIAVRGTGLTNAVILRALDADGAVDVLLSRDANPHSPNMRFSRSLLAAASQGNVAEFSDTGQINASQSILQANIAVAICAPLMLDKTVAAYLYLDSRGNSPAVLRTLRPNASGFCQALCRMAGLALANLKRIDIERRAARLESELSAAAAAQAWILPRAPITAGPFTCIGQSQPGGYLGGDFFDAQVLPDGRLAVSLGDVTGHDA
ncbi:MAG TPA: FHA domain-containing protein, partial [Tepidisphaeraceae bacterium]|nr:FHA domain-containing protein [Tepidisphaeraceae bacterium]